MVYFRSEDSILDVRLVEFDPSTSQAHSANSEIICQAVKVVEIESSETMPRIIRKTKFPMQEASNT
jgi:hypothetical protein